jgi:hypothetical protein
MARRPRSDSESIILELTDAADRVGALGGRFSQTDTPDDGMVVTAVIPCAS